MKHIQIRKGLDLPYTYLGNSWQIHPTSVGVVSVAGYDYPLKPHLIVSEGETCNRGDTLFHSKEDPYLRVVSPVSGRITKIHRGEKRSLIAIEIQIESEEAIRESFFANSLVAGNRETLAKYLAEVGAWVYFRTRPFCEVPNLNEIPQAIFVNAIDTRPGSVGVIPLIRGRERFLAKGLEAVSVFPHKRVYFCESSVEDWNSVFDSMGVSGIIENGKLERVAFSGRHPAGLSSTHIHFLYPVSLGRKVWTIPANLLADIGELLITGVLPNRMRVNLSGPYWKNPCILETITGAKISSLVRNYLPEDYNAGSEGTYTAQKGDESCEPNYRIVSGSILHGWEARGGWDMLGRFHNQISLLRNDTRREFLDWIRPGIHTFSITRSALGRYFPNWIRWDTNRNGSLRAMVPIGNYERVMPLDILPTQLLRALLTKDWEEAIELGALELEEEDLSLCTYVCPGKMDFGKMLIEVLQIAKKELT